jgi:hypothetical protein
MKIQYLALLQILACVAKASPFQQFTVSINVNSDDSKYDYCNLKCTHEKQDCPAGYVSLPYPLVPQVKAF